jgi:hypothetical protein
MTHDADHDPEFEAFLRRRSLMHRRLSQIDHDEPSAELDRVILDRARDAIEAPSRDPIYRKSRWAMPLGLAATILIAFTIVLNIDHRRTAAPDQVAMDASARLAETPAAAPAPQLMERAEQRPDEGQRKDQREEAKRVAKVEAPPPAATADASSAGAGRADNRIVAAAAEPSAEQPALVARAFRESSAEAESDDDALPEATDSGAEIAARRDRTLASNRSLLGPISAAAATGSASANAAAAPATSPVPPPASAPASDPHASADAWLAEITRLRADGKNEEADREMAAFRRAYPAHPGYSLAQPPTR